MAKKIPLGQAYYEEVEALKADGMRNAEAVRAVAEKYKKNENAIRGGIHQYRSRHLNGGAPKRAARRATPAATDVDSAVAEARGLLEDALAGIDEQIAAAKRDLDQAQARYEQLVASAKEHKTTLARRIKALT